MPTVKTRDSRYRRQFEEVYGKVIRHEHWVKIVSEMSDAGLALTLSNVSFYARFKSVCPRKPLTKRVTTKLSEFVTRYRGKSLFGYQLKDLIRADGAVGASLYKPFYQAGFSFESLSRFSFEDSYRILTYAYTTRRREDNLSDTSKS